MLTTYLSASDIRITDDRGEDIGRHCSSLTYNPTISAFELRGPKEIRNDGANTIPDLTGRSPLHLFAMGGRLALLHFEAVTVMPIEIDLDAITITVKDGERRHSLDRGVIVLEHVVLRGARIEVIPATPVP